MIVAVGQHGCHLPIDTRNALVEHVAEEAALRSEGLMLTAPAGEFQTAMYMYLKPELVEKDKMVPRETPSRINRVLYDDLFASGPVHMEVSAEVGLNYQNPKL